MKAILPKYKDFPLWRLSDYQVKKKKEKKKIGYLKGILTDI